MPVTGIGSQEMIRKYRLDEFGFEVEIGKVARQADGAVWFKQGGTIILATAVSAKPTDFPGFLPLQIDYREQFSAAGKIPGGYYKREGRSTDREVLTSRLIDRAIRPLFPVSYFHQLQILPTVYSVDKVHTPNVIALVASSLSLVVSKIPFLGPIGAVEIGRVDGKWVVNPQHAQAEASDTRLIVAGTEEGICMVEGCLNELPETEAVDLLFVAHEQIKKQVAWQLEIQRDLAVVKEEATDEYHWAVWEKLSDAFLTADKIEKVFSFATDKTARNEYLNSLEAAFVVEVQEKLTELAVPSKVASYIFDGILKDKVTAAIFARQKRVDGRPFDQVRLITSEVGLLPFTHGSAMFTRGNTQALVSVTLGGGQDEQRTESVMGEEEKRAFMLHYNFPPFSVGEVRAMRGPGRREVGHGYLAASALKHMLPTKEEFPYTIRVVADMLESDGSTSMATTCGSSMALMHAGVPMKKPVSGIAMGLLFDGKGDFIVLSDIAGFEDAYGLMDLKVTGTDAGITALQMDIKYKGGLPRRVFEQAFNQARQGRLHMLGEMSKAISKPSAELSDLVPKVHTLKVPTDKIGVIIGPGGKTIREIIEKTGTAIDIENDGTVKIFASPEAKSDIAIRWVKTLAGQIEKGATYEGKIRGIREFGIFVELVPGQDGLVHVSRLSREKPMSAFQVDEVVKVEVVDYDAATGKIGLRIIESK